MRHVVMIRREPSLVSIPVNVYCENCETVSTSSGWCARDLRQTSIGPPDFRPAGSEPVSSLQIQPHSESKCFTAIEAMALTMLNQKQAEELPTFIFTF